MALVYSYIRFSTKKQLDGDSLRRQTEDGDDWIRRNNHTPASLRLQDIAVSAFRGKNKDTGALSIFLDAIKTGRVPRDSILLVENLDRLSRQGVNEAFDLFKKILGAGVNIAVLRPYETIYTETHLNDFISLLMPLLYFHLAFIESKNKADRLRKLWDHKRADAPTGKRFDKRCPSWVRWNEGKGEFELIPEGAKAIRFIFEQTAEGKGQRQVLAGLVERFKPIGLSKRWNGSFIQKVLNDRAVLGERQPRSSDAEGKRVAVGNVIVGYYPAVIDEALWHRAQSAKANNKKMKGPNSNFINLFTGRVVNAHDGHPMHVQTSPGAQGGRQRRFVSYGHSRKIKGSDSVTVPYVEFERAVLSHLGELRAEDLESKVSVNAVREKEQELAGVELRLEQLQQDMANPDEDYESAKAAAKITRAKRDALRVELDKLKAELSADQPLKHTQDVLRVLDAADDEQRPVLRSRLRSLIAELVESIHVKPEKHFGRVYCLIQLNYRNGMVRQCNFGPGTHGGSVRPVAEEEFRQEFTVDLREKKASQKPVFTELAKLLAEPSEVVVPKKMPATVGEAAEVFLAVMRSQMSKESFRMIPAKVKRFVDFLGADLPCANVNTARWSKWSQSVKNDVAAKKLADTTARVGWSRAREFVRWLIENEACGPIEGLERSSFEVLA